VRRRTKRGLYSGGWIDVTLEALEPRFLLSSSSFLGNGSGEILGPAIQVDHSPTNIDGSKDDTDGLIGFATRINEDNKKTFADALASFTDDQNGGASDFLATIDWGDGTIEPGSIVANKRAGFDVDGLHSYPFGWHSIKITVTDARAGNESRNTAIESQAYIIPPPLAARGTTIDAVAGHTFNGKIATYVGIDTDQLDNYTANVSWGDYVWSTATLKLTGDGTVEVIGQHDYLKPGAYDIQVTVSENIASPPYILPTPSTHTNNSSGETAAILPWYSLGGTGEQEARTRAIVAVGELDGDIAKLNLTEGVPFSGTIAHFISGANISHYTALIETSDSADPFNGTIRAGGDGFDVVVDHTFLTQWQQINVRIIDDRAGGADAQVGMASASISVAPHLSATVRSFTVMTGREFYGRVGSLQTIGSENWNSEWRVTINWGDGTEASDGQLVANGTGGFDVVGRHTYSIQSYRHAVSISFDVSEKRTPKAPSLGTPKNAYWVGANSFSYGGPGGFVNVVPSPEDVFGVEPMQSYVWDIGSDETTNVAQVSSAANDPGAAGFIGTVTWDNGAVSNASLGWVNDGVYEVDVLPPFSTGGFHSGTLSVTSGGATRTVSVGVSAREPYHAPAPAPALATIDMNSIRATKGVQWSGVVGTFELLQDVDVNDLHAVINWGDGETSDGAITRNNDGTFTVSGSHTYEYEIKNEGYYTQQGSIQLLAGQKGSSGFAEVSVGIDPTLIDINPEYVNARQLEEFSAILGKFTSPVKGASADQFTVTIDWGDGTVENGQVIEGYKHTFEISGTHQYRRDGFFRPVLTVAGPGGTMSIHGSITVMHHPVEVSAGDQPQVDGFAVSGVMATFTDGDGESTAPDRYRVYHAALIDWGDGAITQGQIVANTNGGFDVIGSHTYAQAGDYAMKVIVRRNERVLPQARPMYISWDGLVTANQSASLSDNRSAEFESPTMMLHVDAKSSDAMGEKENAVHVVPQSQSSLFALSPHQEDSLISRMSSQAKDFGAVDDDALLGLQF
jgi:hypothetical protein